MGHSTLINSSFVINFVPLGCVNCLSSVMLCNINLCRYFRDMVGVSVGILCLARPIVSPMVWGGREFFECTLKEETAGGFE